MGTANSEQADIERVRLMHVIIGDLEAPVWFGAGNELVADILVGTSSISFVCGVSFRLYVKSRSGN